MARILVVDDEPDVVELLREVLVEDGFLVDVAPDARGALELIRQTIYDAAILDFNLPDMDGVMLHRAIREMDGELASRTLFMSGMVQTDTNLGYFASQSGGFVSKPFDVGEVLATLRGMLGVRRAPDEG